MGKCPASQPQRHWGPHPDPEWTYPHDYSHISGAEVGPKGRGKKLKVWKGEGQREGKERGLRGQDWSRLTCSLVDSRSSSSARQRTAQAQKAQARLHREPQGQTQTYSTSPLQWGRGEGKGQGPAI